MTLVNIYFTKREGPLNVPSEHFLIWWARKEEKRKAKARVDSGSRAEQHIMYPTPWLFKLQRWWQGFQQEMA